MRARLTAALFALVALGCGGCLPGTQSHVDAARKKVAAAPKSPEAWVELAHALHARGKDEDALDAFETAFDYKSKDVRAYRRAAEIAGSFGMFREARLFADLGLYDHPDDQECLLLAARALLSRGKQRKAKKYLKKLGRKTAPKFFVPRDKALLAKLRYRHEGPVFQVRTDIGSAMAKQISVTAERVFARYQQLVPGLRPPSYKMRIFIFNEKSDYTAMIKRYHGHMAESEGLTVKDPFAIRVIACIESDEFWEGTLRGVEWLNRVLLHEINHVALFLAMGGTPLWLAEGYAEYTSGADPVNSNFAVGGILRRRADVMKQLEDDGYRFPALRSLLHSRNGGLGGGAHPGGFYSYAWSFVHYLHHGAGGKYRDRFQKMMKLAAEGYSVSSAFDTAFEGVDRGSLESGWQSYARGL